VSLRLKLTLVGLVILVLPWSAMRFIGTAEKLLRQGEARAQLAATETLARALGDAVPDRPAEPILYAPNVDNELWIDGYGDDWPGDTAHGRTLSQDGTTPTAWAARVRLARGPGHYFLLIEVDDANIVYRGAPGRRESDHDRIRLALGGRDGDARLIVDTAAPGNITARTPNGDKLARVNGAWRETGSGYSVELRLPRSLMGEAIGVSVGNSNGADGKTRWVGTATHGKRFGTVERHPELDARLDALAASAGNAWLVAPGGWVIAGHHRSSSSPSDDSGGLWRNLIYRYFLASPLEPAVSRSAASMRLAGSELEAALNGDAATSWRAAGGSGVRVSAAQPITAADGSVRGAIVTERTGDGVLLLTDSAIGSVLGTVLAAMAIALGVLVSYAARLSNRIRRLRDAAAAAVDDSGAVTADLPQRHQRDELGDLARGFQSTLTRIDDYTRYLRSLTSKLSHELRTPLAMVTSSLDNLALRELDEDSRRYASRAQNGAQRLDRILRAMGEATRVEQSLQGETFEPFELTGVLGPLVHAYRDIHTDYTIAWSSDGDDHWVNGSAELIGQLVDKLLENAVGFTPAGGWIGVHLERDGDTSALSVVNEGPGLPEHMQGNLFDSLVSVRHDTSEDETPHLGLGLYIVRVIAEVHGCHVSAGDRPQGEGAVFTLYLPQTSNGTPAGAANLRG